MFLKNKIKTTSPWNIFRVKTVNVMFYYIVYYIVISSDKDRLDKVISWL